MEDQTLKRAMRFYLLATKLKYKIRSGWDKEHWNVNTERLESVAEHIYGTCILALSINSELDTEVDIDKVVKMLILHELGEVIIGDITPFDGITANEKRKREHTAMAEVIGDLVKKEEYLALLNEFDERKTKEAIFAYHCDKLEADIQAKVYQDMGRQRSIDDKENVAILKDDKIQKSIRDGADSVFDIWYAWDKEKFKDDKNFMAILNYIRATNTQSIN